MSQWCGEIKYNPWNSIWEQAIWWLTEIKFSGEVGAEPEDERDEKMGLWTKTVFVYAFDMLGTESERKVSDLN